MRRFLDFVWTNSFRLIDLDLRIYKLQISYFWSEYSIRELILQFRFKKKLGLLQKIWPKTPHFIVYPGYWTQKKNVHPTTHENTESLMKLNNMAFINSN